MRVLIVVTHLLGTGHLARALTLASAFQDAGHTPLVVSGGMPAPHLTREGVRLVHLPPLRSDGTDFTRLLTAEGTQADAAYRTQRIDALLAARNAFDPDVVITELFPFGRRNLREEFLALLNTMPARTKVFSSIRDILAPPSKPAKVDFADEMITQHYAGVLVHSDPDLAPLDLSWPVSAHLRPRLHYTGFVAPKPMRPAQDRSGILVSVGGGNVGQNVLRTSLEAARLCPDQRFSLLVGGDETRRSALAKEAPQNVRVEDLSPDFRNRMAAAAASISLVGYNTAMDLLQSGTPGVLVPFDAGQEVEQAIRAKALSALPGFAVIREADLTADHLASSLTQLLERGARAPRLDKMDGAARSVEICAAAVEAT